MFRRLVWEWHGNIVNMNKTLTKYTAVPLIVQSIDAVLAQKDKNAIKAGYFKEWSVPSESRGWEPLCSQAFLAKCFQG